MPVCFHLPLSIPSFCSRYFDTAKQVVKFKLRFLTQTRDILTHISEILPCFSLKSREFLLRYHTVND